MRKEGRAAVVPLLASSTAPGRAAWCRWLSGYPHSATARSSVQGTKPTRAGSPTLGLVLYSPAMNPVALRAPRWFSRASPEPHTRHGPPPRLRHSRARWCSLRGGCTRGRPASVRLCWSLIPRQLLALPQTSGDKGSGPARRSGPWTAWGGSQTCLDRCAEQGQHLLQREDPVALVQVEHDRGGPQLAPMQLPQPSDALVG